MENNNIPITQEIEEDRIYNELIEDICNGKCVLILGPEVCVSENHISYKEYFQNQITEKNLNKDIRYFESENLFSYNSEDLVKTIFDIIKSFYKDSGDEQLLNLISKIKFPLIINVLPDKAIKNVYEKNDFTPNYAFYSKGSIQVFNEIPTKESPVIFNIFGDYEELTSLILTHRDLYETIEDILSKKPFPDKIFNFIQSAVSFIFLGFKFDSWYYQLLCHKLKIKDWKYATKKSIGTPYSDDVNPITVLMKNNFNLSFAKANPYQVIEKLKNILESNSKDPDSNCGDLIREIGMSSNKSVFISYAWKDIGENKNEINRETIVDLTEDEMKIIGQDQVRLIRDKNDTKHGQSIDSFMTLLGKGKSVIRVISDKYLKSVYCMKEAMRIDKYNNTEERIFTIIYIKVNDLGEQDLNLDDPKTIEKYKKYWEDKYKEKTQSPENFMDNSWEYNDYVHIYRFLGEFFSKLKDEKFFLIRNVDFKIEDGKIFLSDEKYEEFKKFTETILLKIKA